MLAARAEVSPHAVRVPIVLAQGGDTWDCVPLELAALAGSGNQLLGRMRPQ